MMVSRHRRTREVTGPTPHSVAIFERPPNKRPPEQLILDRRRKEDQILEAEQMTKYQQYCDLKNDWERWTDKKIQLNTVRRRVQGMMQAERFSVEDRRERLRELLRQEEEQYIHEMEAKEETTLERQTKMREQAKQLKERREAERLAFVQEKLDQQWRNQCEELRSTLSKREQDIVAAERMEQLRMKQEQEMQLAEEEHLYAQLWYKDIEAKAKREEEEAQRKHERNQDVLATLQKQMAALEATKEEEKLLKMEEAELLKQQAQLRKIEEAQALEEKRRKQQETRQMLDRNVRIKLMKKAKEVQEELAFDMKMLEQLLEESRNEAMEQAQRKRELREEDRRYRQYLQQMMEEEKLKERQLERMLDAEVEKMWQKRLAQWRLEREARRRLLQEVLATRKEQMARKLADNEHKRLVAKQEVEDLRRQIEENQRIEDEKNRKIHEKNSRHQQDLLGQMDYNQRQRKIEEDELEREWLAQNAAEIEYQQKLKDALERPEIDRPHPMRRAARQKSAMSGILG